MSPGPASAWRRKVGASAKHPVVTTNDEGTLRLRFTDQFTAGLQEESNIAERHLVTALLTRLFEVDPSETPSLVDLVAPLGPKRMLNAFNEDNAPDMRAERLPHPLLGTDRSMLRSLTSSATGSAIRTVPVSRWGR